MKEGTSVEAHMKRMKESTDKLSALGAPIAEEDQVVTLLGSLPASFQTLVTALEARDIVTLSHAQQSLIHEEKKLNGEYGRERPGDSGTALYHRVDKQDIFDGTVPRNHKSTTLNRLVDTMQNLLKRCHRSQREYLQPLLIRQ